MERLSQSRNDQTSFPFLISFFSHIVMERSKILVIIFCLAAIILISGYILQGSRPQGSTQNASSQQTNVSTTESPLRVYWFEKYCDVNGALCYDYGFNDGKGTVAVVISQLYPNNTIAPKASLERFVYEGELVSCQLTEEELNKLDELIKLNKLEDIHQMMQSCNESSNPCFTIANPTYSLEHGYKLNITEMGPPGPASALKPIIFNCGSSNLTKYNVHVLYFKVGKWFDKPTDSEGFPILNWRPPEEYEPCQEYENRFGCFDNGTHIWVTSPQRSVQAQQLSQSKQSCDVGGTPCIGSFNGEGGTFTLNIRDPKGRERYVYGGQLLSCKLTEKMVNRLNEMKDLNEIMSYCLYEGRMDLTQQPCFTTTDFRYTGELLNLTPLFEEFSTTVKVGDRVSGFIPISIAGPVTLYCGVQTDGHGNPTSQSFYSGFLGDYSLLMLSFRTEKKWDKPIGQDGYPISGWRPPAEEEPCLEDAYKFYCYEPGMYAVLTGKTLSESYDENN